MGGPAAFKSQYEEWCKAQHRPPSKHVLVMPDKQLLSCYVDRLPAEHVEPFTKALGSDRSLRHLHLTSSLQDEGKSPELLVSPALGRSLLHQLQGSLTSLILQGLSLPAPLVACLTQGLSATTTLEHLSLAGSHLSAKSLSALCGALKKSSSLRRLDLANCGLTQAGMQAVAGLVKSQQLRLYSDLWKASLRYHLPCIDDFHGLSRLTLSDNPALECQGVQVLAEALQDDFWMRALDLQRCKVGNTGAQALLRILQSSSVYEIVDLRGNPDIKKVLLKKIITKLKENTAGKIREYDWMPLEAPHQVPPARKPLPPKKPEPSHSAKKIDPHHQCRVTLRRHQEMLSRSREELRRVRQQLEREKAALAHQKALPPPGHVLVDEATLDHVQRTFSQFQRFLDLVNHSRDDKSVDSSLPSEGPLNLTGSDHEDF